MKNTISKKKFIIISASLAGIVAIIIALKKIYDELKPDYLVNTDDEFDDEFGSTAQEK